MKQISLERSAIHKEYEYRVNNGTIDVLSEMQSLIAPKRDNTIIGHDWYRGKVISIVNGKTYRVKIGWNREGLHADDPTETVQYLKDNKYNPKKTKEGAWRQYFDLRD